MKDIKPFNTSLKPKRPNPFLMPVEWIGSLLLLLGKKGKITYHNCEDLKPPYIFLSNHGSMVDFAIAAKANFPHRCNWVISIEEFVGREGLFRGIGGIYKRKFTSDVTVIKHILQVLKKDKGILVMYPEARYSLAGINERMSGAIGSLVKMANCPLVVMLESGNFVSEPQWNKKPNRGNVVEANVTQIVSREELATLSADEIQERLEKFFVYDDYAWQYDNKIKIKSQKRANNIHKILYQCPVCKKEFTTDSKDTSIWCNNCNSKWEMDEYGKLHCVNHDETFTHVPDWYRWERENVREEVRSGNYKFEDTVRVEKLVNCQVGFSNIGNVTLTHDYNGFTLKGVLSNGEEFELNRAASSMESCHIEYEFYKKGVSKSGDALELSTSHDTYFVFPQNAFNPLTKLHFATEEIHDMEIENNPKKKT